MTTRVQDELRAARVILVERMLLDALRIYDSGDIEGAQAKMNSQIRSMPSGGLKASAAVLLWQGGLRCWNGGSIATVPLNALGCPRFCVKASRSNGVYQAMQSPLRVALGVVLTCVRTA